ncbi:MAG: methyltransferase domain-containing protein [Gammaproteobacteria bacterium]|nr:methyltransferase domain-containing protein [Gammaproteobacteria bacterium]
MTDSDSYITRQRQLRAWFDLPLGRSLQALEAHYLRTILPNLYGTVAAQLGYIGHLDLMDSCIAPTRIMLDGLGEKNVCVVRGRPEILPFDSKSADVLLLPHTLDFCDDPHQVLREVSRVLRPEGHVVILGFNPMSLWGLRRLFARRPLAMPWCGKFFRLSRVKDWLNLLELETTHGMMLHYRPPLQNAGFMQRLHFLDKMGDRWWPMMATVYLIVAKKRVIGVTPLPLRWKTKRLAGAVATQPAARGMVVRFQPRRPKHLG